MKKQIFVNDVHDYDYELTDNNVHILYYSNGSQWNNHIKSTICMSIKNDGNGFVVKFNEKGRIDYSEAEQLFILLKLVSQPAKYEIANKVLL
jgi:hypothetical protein